MRRRLLCAGPRVGPSHRYADPAHLLSRVRTPFACSSLLTLLGALIGLAAAQPGYRPANIWLRRLGSHLSPSNAAHRSLALPKLLGLMHGFFTSSRSIIYFRWWWNENPSIWDKRKGDGINVTVTRGPN